MANYLDKNGIVYLWGKIKAKFVTKERGIRKIINIRRK